MNQPQATIATAESQVSTSANGHYAPCQECGAPLDRDQRYCISCGARRGDAANPTSRYFAAASRQRRALATRKPGTRSATSRAAVVGFFVLLPVAVAAGVLVGRSGMNNDNGAVQQALEALRNQPATAVAATGSGTSTPVSDTSKLLPSDWSMDQGYTVKLGLLPINTTDQQAASKAKSDAESKGAKDVGIISPKDFATTPDQGSKDYVLYSGEFKSKADATKALGGLKKDFSQAQVVEVQAAGSGGGGSVNSKVVAHTSHGVVHQVSGFHPSQQEIQKDTQTVQNLAHQTGKNYINSQKTLPDITVVGGDPNSAPPLPTGGGD
jgi:hypothetical protein